LVNQGKANRCTRRDFLAAFPLLAAGSAQIFSRHRTAAELPLAPQSKVHIFLGFQADDYIQPASDDALKRLAAFLNQQGIRATFQVAGEKARELDRRGRHDVIGALAQHEIAYCSDTASQHPTVAEFESRLDWQSGSEEFDRRERRGYDSVRRVFGQTPICYGHPGEAWAPQSYPALRGWGIKVYLARGAPLSVEGKPFWYDGMLNLVGIQEGANLRPNAAWSNLADAKANFQDSYLRLSSQPAGGVACLWFRPCEFVETETWDEVNFARGAQPARDDWKQPPLKSPQDSERAFQYFQSLAAYMKSFPRAEFITASQALALLSDRAQRHVYPQEQLAAIAAQVSPQVSFYRGQGYALAPSEVFFLLNTFVANVVHRTSQQPILLDGIPDGPASRVPALASPLQVPWEQLARAVLDVEDFLRQNKRLPNAVWFGSQAAPPECYLGALAQAVSSLLSKAARPETVRVTAAQLATGRYVADDSPTTWNWNILPPGFHAPNLITLAKLQAWTLKPATL
jgi:hypothetical protein